MSSTIKSLGSLWHIAATLLLMGKVQMRIKAERQCAGNLLVVAPHPDDEVLGAAGILLSSIKEGSTVNILYLTDGEGSGADPDPCRVRHERLRLTERVRQSFGIAKDQLHRFHLPDGLVPLPGHASFEAVSDRLATLIDALEPDVVLATHALDFWPKDHVACAELAQAAVARANHRSELCFYWVWAWYNLRPWRLRLSEHPGLRRVDISPWTKAKRSLVSLYLDPKSPSGIPWSGRLPLALRWAARFKIEVLERMG